MSDLENFTHMKYELEAAERYVEHIHAAGRGGERARVHCVGANPEINIQYETGGKNYWSAKQEGGQAFVDCLNSIIARKLPGLFAETINLMKENLNEHKEKAKKEYQELFGEEINATLEATKGA